MKINILYFSSTGNTLWLIDIMQSIFENNGHHVKKFDVITENGQWEQNYDMLGIVYPVWCSDLPTPIIERVKQMKQGHGQRIFLIGNAGVFSGDTDSYWHRRFKKLGYDVFYADHVLLPINTCFPNFNFFKMPSEDIQEEMKSKAKKQVIEMTNDILSNKCKIRKHNFSDLLGGYGQRLTFYKNLTKGRIKNMYINQKRCINCKICYRICPTQAIQLENTRPIISDKSKCIFCLKCYNLCPIDAVLIEERSENTDKYKRYKGNGKNFKPISYR